MSMTTLPRDWPEGLEAVLAQMSQATGKTWITFQDLAAAYQERYSVALEALTGGDRASLKRLLVESRRFAIYNSPVPGEFYVARKFAYAPDCQPSQPVQPTAPSGEPACSAIAPPVPWPASLTQARDLTQALRALVAAATGDRPTDTIPVADLAKAFYQHYHRPLRSSLRELSPGWSLEAFLAQQAELRLQPTASGVTVALSPPVAVGLQG
mgnify:CR=1 FL=1